MAAVPAADLADWKLGPMRPTPAFAVSYGGAAALLAGRAHAASLIWRRFGLAGGKEARG